ncbi:response regulator [Desulfatitalea alkaliphila]|uniref:Response regulator n=1 Tax=Desulfatitalea alkaliphila TaxID=2929485 RepID=A0AA41R6B3_9BACT|nr:response regulator [Desulfatitalea alkaliphila]MCJ8501955.1 response regulator [Desulfatitalea alkaliphila]
MTYKILTVDDSRTIRTIVKNAFKSYECELFEAENGRDGLALAAEVRPDLIILDITMPVMTGIEMLGKMMADDTLKETAVIMLTAESGRDNVMNIVKMGVKDYMVKPFKGEQLIERVQLVLPDLKQRIDASAGAPAEAHDALFTVDGDVVVLTLPTKITRNVSETVLAQAKAKARQMTDAGARKLVIDLSGIVNLNMTAMQALLAVINLCLRAKLDIRLVATASQQGSLQGFQETGTLVTQPSLSAAVADFFASP